MVSMKQRAALVATSAFMFVIGVVALASAPEVNVVNGTAFTLFGATGLSTELSYW